MNTWIFHSANSGLYFWDGETGILLDGLYRGRDCGFSNLPAGLVRIIKKPDRMPAPINGLLFTHCHPDHFDAALVKEFVKCSQVVVYGPNFFPSPVETCPTRPGLTRLRIGTIYILCCETTHDGEKFASVPHSSFFIHAAGENFFVAGDANLNERVAEFYRNCHNEPITAAFLNVYQALSPETFLFLRNLAPQRIFLYHLPFPADDHSGFYRLSQQAIQRFPMDLPSLELLGQMAWIDGKAPNLKEESSQLKNI